MPKIETTEIAIVIVAPNYDPTLLNPSFLNYSGVVPPNWELARKPVINQRGSQIVYSNGINLIAQPNRLTTVEAFKPSSSIETPSIIKRYIELLPHLDYQAVGLNFRGYITFTEETLGAHQYLFKTLLAPGEWLEAGTSPVQAGLNFVYTFNEHRLNLSINEATIQHPESEPVNIILFSGNFDYNLNEETQKERTSQLQEIIANWQKNQEIYQEVVDKFVEPKLPEKSLIPLVGARG